MRARVLDVSRRLPAPIRRVLRPAVRAGRAAVRFLRTPRTDAALRRRLEEVEERHRILVHAHTEIERHGLSHALSSDLTGVAPFLRFAQPGHFYSPIPDLRDVDKDAGRIFDRSLRTIPGVDMREEAQLELFSELADTLTTWSFPDEADGEHRYFSGPGNFAYNIGDGMILHAMLRRVGPKRFVEIGSGFSSCVTLDTNERFLDGSMDITFVEPYPELLYSLIRPQERHRVRVLETRLQNVPDEVFSALEAGDVLFIDSTHVARVGSDVLDVFGRVLPLLAKGVIVHFHDVFWPFEYPESWVREGRAWTELYVLRSFLQFNHEFEIMLFNDYLAAVHRDLIATRLPRMLENPGGAMWLRRRAHSAS